MATQVNTWTEFVAAFRSNTITEIDIMKDLFCNEDLPTSGIKAGTAKTISGNYHTIWNLSTSRVVSSALIYTEGTALTWEKTNFNNIYRNEYYPVFAGLVYTYITFNDCTFVCSCPQKLFDYVELNRCAITHTGSTYYVPFENVRATNCWIKYEHKRNVDTSDREFANLTNCYVEGKITTDLSIYTTVFDICYYLNSSVINIETDLPTRISSNPQINTVTVFNTDKLTNYRGSLNKIVGVSDNQMKDATYLSSVGFNIVV